MLRRPQWPGWLLDAVWDWHATPHPADRRFPSRLQRTLDGLKRPEWWRWQLWGLLTRSRHVCPVNAHSSILRGNWDRGLRVDESCRRDCAENGACYCGNLRQDEARR